MYSIKNNSIDPLEWANILLNYPTFTAAFFYYKKEKQNEKLDNRSFRHFYYCTITK